VRGLRLDMVVGGGLSVVVGGFYAVYDGCFMMMVF
jgi:hypothetical protein